MSNILFGNYTVTSPIQADRTVMGVTKNHNGTDYGVPLNTIIQSTTSGTVIQTGYDADGYGNYVKVQDSGGNIHTYAHLNKISVNKGDNVNRYSALGLSGNTGRSTGPHLHYEVRNSSGSVLDGTAFVGGASDPTTMYDPLPLGNSDGDGLGRWQNVLSTVIVFIVLFGVFVLAVYSFMKAFDISIPNVPNITSLLKGGNKE